MYSPQPIYAHQNIINNYFITVNQVPPAVTEAELPQKHTVLKTAHLEDEFMIKTEKKRKRSSRHH